MEETIQEFCVENEGMRLHRSSKKTGRLLCNVEWDLISNTYELQQLVKKDKSLLQPSNNKHYLKLNISFTHFVRLDTD